MEHPQFWGDLLEINLDLTHYGMPLKLTIRIYDDFASVGYPKIQFRTPEKGIIHPRMESFFGSKAIQLSCRVFSQCFCTMAMEHTPKKMEVSSWKHP
jgi:hypothetical protein